MADVEAPLTLPTAAPPSGLQALPHLLPTAQISRLQVGDPQPSAADHQEQQQRLQGAPRRGLLDLDPDPELAPPRLPVHMRHTSSSRMHAAVDPQSESGATIWALLRRGSGEGARGLSGGGGLPPLGASAAAAAAAAAAEHGGARHRAENVRELVARKRQIFLAQMSLDTKHAEISKLEKRAAQREEALTVSWSAAVTCGGMSTPVTAPLAHRTSSSGLSQAAPYPRTVSCQHKVALLRIVSYKLPLVATSQASEQALDADSQRFEEYLKQNDAKLQGALRRAEGEARARSERAAEAKRVAGSIAALRSEMGKIEEQVQECQR